MKHINLRHKKVLLVLTCSLVGVVVYLASGFAKSYPPPQSNSISNLPQPPKAVIAEGVPTAINIPKIGKNLPIKPATVRGNDWDMFEDAVAWLSTSAVPDKGNVILYAHDWKPLWADLYTLKVGDIIDIQQNDAWRRYAVTESRAVDQHDIKSILSEKNRLTLYTCEGSFDQKRRVVYAEPLK